jgi:hypothetical protein
MNENARSIAGARARNFEMAGIRRDKRLCDPQTKTRPGDRGGMPLTTKEPLAGTRPLLRRKPGTAVRHRNRHVVPRALPLDLDMRSGSRILHRIVEDLNERLLDQHRIHVNQWQIGGDTDGDVVSLQAGTAALDGGVDDIGDFRPFELRMHALARNARGVQEIFDVVIQSF